MTLSPVDGAFVAAAVVTLLQYGRYRERAMLLLALLFLLLAGAAARESWEIWQVLFKLAAVAVGLWLLGLLSRRAAAARGDGQGS